MNKLKLGLMFKEVERYFFKNKKTELHLNPLITGREIKYQIKYLVLQFKEANRASVNVEGGKPNFFPLYFEHCEQQGAGLIFFFLSDGSRPDAASNPVVSSSITHEAGAR